MTDQEFDRLAQQMRDAAFTPQQAKQISGLAAMALVRAEARARPALLQPLTRVMHDAEHDDK
jgi:hypothetical protein